MAPAFRIQCHAGFPCLVRIGTRHVRHQECPKVAGKLGQEIPVAFLVLEQEIKNHRAIGHTVPDFGIGLVTDPHVHHLFIRCIQIQKVQIERKDA